MRFQRMPDVRRASSRLGVESIEVRVSSLRRLLDDFIYDVGAVMAGLEPDLAYVAPGTADLLRDALRPFHDAGYRVDPDFGDTAQAHVTGLDGQGVVRADLTLSDRSVLVAADGRREASPRQSWRLTVLVDHPLERVIGFRVQRSSKPNLRV